jgi:hypothetical protein
MSHAATVLALAWLCPGVEKLLTVSPTASILFFPLARNVLEYAKQTDLLVNHLAAFSAIKHTVMHFAASLRLHASTREVEMV